MSSYCGSVNRRGEPIEGGDLAAMASGYPRHAPDASGRWVKESAGFYHAMHFTTPELLAEHLPWQDPVSGLVITADVRIDNRSELGADLGLSATKLRSTSDSELVLKCYLLWQEAMLPRLLGDFSFAIWDPRRRTLFCARDHLGVRPFYYTLAGENLIFATDLKAVFAHSKVSKRLNVDQWLAVVTYVDPAPEETFYAGIRRLAPGRWLRFDERGLDGGRYWSLDPSFELPARPDDEYAGEFRRLFTESVRSRLRSAHPVGTHLSGGLDSSAVTCVAREVLRADQNAGHLPLRTVSNIMPTIKQCDESEYITSVVAGGDLAPSYARSDTAGSLFAADDFFEDEPDFVLRANGYLLEQISAASREARIRIILDGFDGDTTVSHGSDRFAELTRAGNWAAFSREASLYARLIPGVRKDILFHTYALPTLDRLATTRQWKRYVTGSIALARHYDRTAVRPLAKHLFQTFSPAWMLSLAKAARAGSKGAGQRSDSFPFFTAPFAAKLRAFEQAHVAEANGEPSARTTQCQALSSGLFSNALEMMDRIYKRYGMEGRHPFLDKRLVEFCVALPSDQKMRHGQGRFIMRSSLRGTLPDAIRLRFGKTDYTAAHVAGFVRYDACQILRLIRALPAHYDAFVKRDALVAYVEHLLKTREFRERQFLDFFHALMSMVLLQKAGLTPP